MMLRWPVSIFFLFLIMAEAGYTQNNDAQTGSFTLSGSVKSILGEEVSESYQALIDPNMQITWEIDVPENYAPSNPPGVMVFAGSPRNVRPPNGWLAIMKDKYSSRQPLCLLQI